jgi:hypothetical protein
MQLLYEQGSHNNELSEILELFLYLSMTTYYHGTSTAHLGTIKEQGLRPPLETGQQTEKRKGGLEEIFLLADTEEGRRFAEGYAIRASQKFGGEPIVLRLEIDETQYPVRLEREGRIDQWAVDSLPVDCIKEEIKISEASTERMVEIFKSLEHRPRPK